MLATDALRAARATQPTQAGDRVTLAARPAGVLHVYVGLLTPGGGAIPRRRRPVCRAATRHRLYVVPAVLSPREHSRDTSPARRLCLRCSALLEKAREGLRRRPAGGAPVTRDQWAAAFADLTETDLWLSYLMADTQDEIDRCRWLASLLFDRLLPDLPTIRGRFPKSWQPQARPDGKTHTWKAWRNALARFESDYWLQLEAAAS